MPRPESIQPSGPNRGEVNAFRNAVKYGPVIDKDVIPSELETVYNLHRDAGIPREDRHRLQKDLWNCYYGGSAEDQERIGHALEQFQKIPEIVVFKRESNS